MEDGKSCFDIIEENQHASSLNQALGVDAQRAAELGLYIKKTQDELVEETYEIGFTLSVLFSEVCKRRHIIKETEKLFLWTLMVTDPSAVVTKRPPGDSSSILDLLKRLKNNGKPKDLDNPEKPEDDGTPL